MTHIRVSRLEPQFLGGEAVANDTGALLAARVRTYGVAYPVRFEYGPGAGFGTQTATVLTEPETGVQSIFKSVAGLTSATAYSWRPLGLAGAFVTATGPTATVTTTAQNGPGSGGSARVRAARPVAPGRPARRARPVRPAWPGQPAQPAPRGRWAQPARWVRADRPGPAGQRVRPAWPARPARAAGRVATRP